MSNPAEYVEITLTPDREARAKRDAEAQAARFPEDRGDFAPYGGIPRDDRLYQAAAAKQAVAQLLGRPTLPIGVKSQWSRLSAASAHLKVPPDAAPNVRWLLVIDRAPTFRIVGGIFAREACDLGELRDGDDVPRAAWFVRPAELHPLRVSAA